MKKQNDEKDRVDSISKIIGDKLSETKQKILNLSFNQLLKGSNLNPKLYYHLQNSEMSKFSIELNNLIKKEKKSALNAIKAGTKLVGLDSKQRKKVEAEISKGFQDIQKKMLQNQQSNVGQIFAEATTVLHNGVTDSLVEIIQNKVKQTNDYGTVIYKDGRNVRWENYMEMKVRTDVQQDITKNMIKDGSSNGVVFYITSFYGDCAKDHADFQGKIYVDENWESICPKDRLDEVSSYIKTNKCMTIQDAIGPKGNYFTTRPNCRHFFQYVDIDSVIGAKSVNTLRDNLNLNYNGKYHPEKYEALKDQRYNERMIRQYKGKAEAQQKLIDNLPSDKKELKPKMEAELANLKYKVRSAQKEQRELLKKNTFLDRRYDREAYSKMIIDFRKK